MSRKLAFKQHFQLMADYNCRMNRQVYQASSQLGKGDLQKDVGAFFGSVLGSLNHILVGDLVWLARFSNHSNDYESLKQLDKYRKPMQLNSLLYPEFSELYNVRQEVDLMIQTWVRNETKEEHFELDLTYSNTKDETSSRCFGELVSHLFNHQTHHRGQITTLLYQFGYDVGVTDFLIDIPDNQI